jgi:hypothetical protein
MPEVTVLEITHRKHVDTLRELPVPAQTVIGLTVGSR